MGLHYCRRSTGIHSRAPALLNFYKRHCQRHWCLNSTLRRRYKCIYIVVETPQSAATILNGDMSTINDWSKLWLVNFNAAKTLSMVVSRKVNKPIHPPLFMNNVQINETQSHKHLGVTFSSTCLWTDHIENICEKAWVRLNLMRALKFRISRKSLSSGHF